MDLMSNPKFATFINEFQKLMKTTQETTLDEARKQSTAFFAPQDLVKEKVGNIKDIKVAGSDGHEIPVRLYYPASDKPAPLLIYYHRGGWVFSNIEESDAVCRKFANHLGCCVASVDYRLAPENPFPKPFNDCYDAFEWLANNQKNLGIDSDTVIIAGESCGGNLAAAVCLKARDTNGPSISAQLLIYPIITAKIDSENYQKSADQYFLTESAMRFFWSAYAQNPEDLKNPYVSLDEAQDLTNLPAAVVITAEHDPLHTEGELFAKKLQEAGNLVVLDRCPGVVHGFLDLPVYPDEQVTAWLHHIKERMTKALEAVATADK